MLVSLKLNCGWFEVKKNTDLACMHRTSLLQVSPSTHLPWQNTAITVDKGARWELLGFIQTNGIHKNIFPDFSNTLIGVHVTLKSHHTSLNVTRVQQDGVNLHANVKIISVSSLVMIE